ncbi:MAG: PAS domain S-box protein [Deltaproteobacteria bacterium]|nr:PAS domain S-box protein [Deltaproteobacteria bacterium]
MRELNELEKFKTAVDISLDAILAVDEGGRITLWNRAAGLMFGYSEAEAAGGSIEIIIPDEYREAHRKGMERFLATGETKVIGKTVELEGLRKDGLKFPVELSLSAEKLDGSWMFIGVIRDMTIRRRLENELEQRLTEMERMNKVMVGRELKMEELRQEVRRLRSVCERTKGR